MNKYKFSFIIFIDAIRRRSGLRGTFAVHRNPLTTNPLQSREKSPVINRNSVSRHSTIAVTPINSPDKIDKDILKHASRIRRPSQSKDYLIKSPRIDSASISTSPSRTNNNKKISIKKPLKSISLVSYNSRSYIDIYVLFYRFLMNMTNINDENQVIDLYFTFCLLVLHCHHSFYLYLNSKYSFQTFFRNLLNFF